MDDMRRYPTMLNLYKIGTFPNLGKRYLTREYESPLFESLVNADWEVTEKVDGTNIRIGWDGDGTVTFTGRENKNSRLPDGDTGVQELLESTFTVDRFLAGPNPRSPMTIFCEVFGPNIGKYGHLYGDRPTAVVLDVLIDGWWLQRDRLAGVAEMLGLELPPLLDTRVSLTHASNMVAIGLRSQFGAPGPEFFAEGVVARPVSGILDRAGRPIRVKIKHQYFHGKERVINE